MTTQTEALKLALEALEKLTGAAEGFSVSGVYFNEELWARKCLDDAYDAMGFAQEALAQPEQEPEFVTHNVDKPYDWSEWVCPNPSGYLMKCCDCGLVHEAEFGVVRYKSETEREDCDMVDDPNLQAVFRMRRSEKWSPEDTAHRAGGLPMAQPEQEQNLKLMPREATPEMLKAMDECSTEGYDERLYEGHAGSVYMAAWDAFYSQHCYCGDITNLGVIHRDDGPCHYPEHTSEYKRGYADAMNWKVQNHLEHLPAAQPEQEPDLGGVGVFYPTEQEPVAKAMTAHRAAYFMERFKHEEKLLGPNEQAALDFVISMLEAQPEQEPVGRLESDPDEGHVFVPRIEGDWSMFGKDLYTTPPQRKPLTVEQIHKASTQAGMQEHYMGFHSGFIRFARAIEAAHGIKGDI